jgi:anti-sigma B factor antagonist
MDFGVATLRLGRRAYSITVSGELDLFTCGELQAELARVDRDVAWALVDLSDVTFIDSTGLALLVRFAQRLRGRRGGVVLVVGDGSIGRLLRATHLDYLFEVRDAGDDAVRYLVGRSLLDSLERELPLDPDVAA